MDITDPTTPKEIQHVLLKGNGAATQINLTPDQSYLQVVAHRNSANTQEGNAVNVLKVNSDGTVTEVNTSPLKLPSVNNSFPQGVASIKNN